MPSTTLCYNDKNFIATNSDILTIKQIISNYKIMQVDFSQSKTATTILFSENTIKPDDIKNLLNGEDKPHFVADFSCDTCWDDEYIDIECMVDLNEKQIADRKREFIEISKNMKDLINSLSDEILDAFELYDTDDLRLADLFEFMEFFKSTFSLHEPHPNQIELNFSEG